MVFTKTHLFNRTKTFHKETEHYLCFEHEIKECLLFEIGIGLQLETRPPYLGLGECKNETHTIPKFGFST